MLYHPMSRAEQNRAYLLCLRAFNGSTGFPQTAQEAASAALAEACTLYANGASISLWEIFVLSDAVKVYRDENCKTEAASYDLASLVKATGRKELASLAIRLCGAYLDDETRTWRDGEGAVTDIVFPENFVSTTRL